MMKLIEIYIPISNYLIKWLIRIFKQFMSKTFLKTPWLVIMRLTRPDLIRLFYKIVEFNRKLDLIFKKNQFNCRVCLLCNLNHKIIHQQIKFKLLETMSNKITKSLRVFIAQKTTLKIRIIKMMQVKFIKDHLIGIIKIKSLKYIK